MIIVNVKSYKTGKPLLQLAKLIEKYDKNMILALKHDDVSALSTACKLKMYAQHADTKEIPMLKKAAAHGTLLNHSDHRIPFAKLKETLAACKRAGLSTVVCVENIREAKKVVEFKPNAIALEEKDLIGTGKSITTHSSETVKAFAHLLKGTGIQPLCGAGISTAVDVEKAYELGCTGVLIASAIAAVADPEQLLADISHIKRH